MYTPEEKTSTRKRYEFRLAAAYDGNYHATIRDLTDTIHVALARLKDVKGEKAADFDDALHVYPADDSIVIYFEVAE